MVMSTRSNQFQPSSSQGVLVLSGFELHISHQKKSYSLDLSIFLSSVAVPSHIVHTYVLLSERMNMGPSGSPKYQPHLWQTIILFFISLLISPVQKRSSLFGVCLHMHPQVHLQLTQMDLVYQIRSFLSAEWNDLEFSFLLKERINFMYVYF